MTPPAVKRCAEAHGLPILQPRSVRNPDIAAALAATGAELGVVVAYGKILPPAVLDAFPRGCINVHGSLLPAYRGAAPIQWAVLDGRAETGVTIMQLDVGMDTGPILLTRTTPIGATETAGELFARLAPLGRRRPGSTRSPSSRRAPSRPGRRRPTAPSHARMLDKRDGAIDFARPCAVVAAHIRGVDPWPGAVAARGDEQVKLFGARAMPGAVSAPPGTVVAIDDAGAPPGVRRWRRDRPRAPAPRAPALDRARAGQWTAVVDR
jgi:methionyl-tRNA formyltransferase